MEENTNENLTKNIGQTADRLAGNALATASNKLMPIVAPTLVQILWKQKWNILIAGFLGVIIMLLGVDSSIQNATAQSRTLIDMIPKEHRECITRSATKYFVEFELIASYGKVIADFKEDHTGAGKGFLEIEEATWKEFGVDGNENTQITAKDICDNYYTLANKLSSLTGDSEQKIDLYSYPKKDDVKEWYQIYKGVMQVPYGNPVGLEREDLVVITSGYLERRNIDGVIDIHYGVDMVPSGKWHLENPGSTRKDAINRALITGKVTNTKDSAGTLCSHVENGAYKVMHCHCDSFIAQHETFIKYGDPMCFMGTTGRSTGVHTHTEIYKAAGNGNWERIDPIPYLFPKKNDQ